MEGMRKMKNNFSEALTEVDEILNYVPQSYIAKLPMSLKKFVKENKSENYIFHIDESIAIEEQSLKKETRSFIAILLLKYWNRDNKEKLIEIYNENDKKYQEELHEKYNVNILDKNVKKNEIKTDIIEYKKENRFVQILKNILKSLKGILRK